jgi:BlaI family penicillinase repressor
METARLSKTPKSPQPSEAELEILHVLWRQGPCTVREVWEVLEGRGVVYTTVLKQLQVMAQKKLVMRDAAQRAHTYAANIAQAEVQRRAMADIRGQRGSTGASRPGVEAGFQ